MYLRPGVYKCVCACVCMCVWPSSYYMLNSSTMWCDMDPYDWLDIFYTFYVAAVIDTISRFGITIEMCHRNQPT